MKKKCTATQILQINIKKTSIKDTPNEYKILSKELNRETNNNKKETGSSCDSSIGKSHRDIIGGLLKMKGNI